jgi:hypothetical protein
MQEPEWDRDHLSYLTGHVVLEALDFGGDGVRESFWYVQHNLLKTTPPFESWSQERRLRIAREVMISLARDGLAEFSEAMPIHGLPEWVPRRVRGLMYRMGLAPGVRVVSWEESTAWHREHLLPDLEVVAMLDRNVDLWWAGQHAQRYSYFLTDKGMALGESWWTNFQLISSPAWRGRERPPPDPVRSA